MRELPSLPRYRTDKMTTAATLRHEAGRDVLVPPTQSPVADSSETEVRFQRRVGDYLYS